MIDGKIVSICCCHDMSPSSSCETGQKQLLARVLTSYDEVLFKSHDPRHHTTSFFSPQNRKPWRETVLLLFIHDPQCSLSSCAKSKHTTELLLLMFVHMSTRWAGASVLS